MLVLPAMAQKESSDVRKGNRQYGKEQYTEAEVSYRKGLDKNNNSFEGHFNLGDALFRQEKYPEAIEEFQKAGALVHTGKDGKYTDADKKKLAAVHHNMGNAFYAQQQFDKAVNEYKAALRANPKDDETRYNLIKAMQMLQQQQQQQQNQDQQQDQQQQQQQEQQQQDQQDQQDKQDPPQEQPDDQQMDKEQAEQILKALEQDEQDTQDKAKRQQQKTNFRTDKDW